MNSIVIWVLIASYGSMIPIAKFSTEEECRVESKKAAKASAIPERAFYCIRSHEFYVSGKKEPKP